MKRMLSALRRFGDDLDEVIRDLGGRPDAMADRQGNVLDATAMALLAAPSAFDLIPPPSNEGGSSFKQLAKKRRDEAPKVID